MRKVGLAVLVLFAAFSTPYLIQSAQADDHTYNDCVGAASYQLAECLNNVCTYPDLPYNSTDCWETFYLLRDNELGCDQFNGGPSEV